MKHHVSSWVLWGHRVKAKVTLWSTQRSSESAQPTSKYEQCISYKSKVTGEVKVCGYSYKVTYRHPNGLAKQSPPTRQ